MESLWSEEECCKIHILLIGSGNSIQEKRVGPSGGRDLFTRWLRSYSTPGALSGREELLGSSSRHHSPLWGIWQHLGKLGLKNVTLCIPSEENWPQPSWRSREITMSILLLQRNTEANKNKACGNDFFFLPNYTCITKCHKSQELEGVIFWVGCWVEMRGIARCR